MPDPSTYGRAQLRELLYHILYAEEEMVTIPCADHAQARSLQNRINKLRAFERKTVVDEQRRAGKLFIDDGTPLDNLTIRVAAGDKLLRIHNGKQAKVSLFAQVMVENPDGTTRPLFPDAAAPEQPEAPAPKPQIEDLF